MEKNILIKNINFTTVDTNVAKGFAILLLLFHHLFVEYDSNAFISYLAHVSKVCVAIFILVSGYGLYESIKDKTTGLYQFYIKRLSKIYLNYWFIALIFISYGVFAAGRTLDTVYHDHVVLKFISNMLGMHMYLKQVGFGYNETWWFITLIITLYILFPFIIFAMKKFPLLFLLFAFIATTFLPIPSLLIWTFPFITGMYLAKYAMLVKMIALIRAYKIAGYLLLLITLGIFIFLRQYYIDLFHTKMDWLLSIVIIIFVYEILANLKTVKSFLAFIGVHSFNIFLFHTFLYKYYFHDFIYGFTNPIIIFLVLLFLSLGVSMLLEKVKAWIHLEKLYTMIVKYKPREFLYIKV